MALSLRPSLTGAAARKAWTGVALACGLRRVVPRCSCAPTFVAHYSNENELEDFRWTKTSRTTAYDALQKGPLPPGIATIQPFRERRRNEAVEAAVARGRPTLSEVLYYCDMMRQEKDFKSAFGVLQLSRRLGQAGDWPQVVMAEYVELCGRMKRLDLAIEFGGFVRKHRIHWLEEYAAAMVAALTHADQPARIAELNDMGLLGRESIESERVQQALIYFFDRTHQPEQFAAFVRALFANAPGKITPRALMHALRVAGRHGDSRLCFEIVEHMRRWNVPILPRALLSVMKGCAMSVNPSVALWVGQLVGHMGHRILSEMTRRSGPSSLLMNVKYEVNRRYDALVDAFSVAGDALTCFAVAEVAYARGHLFGRTALIGLARSVFPNGSKIGGAIRIDREFRVFPLFSTPESTLSPPQRPTVVPRSMTRHDVLAAYTSGRVLYGRRLLEFGRINMVCVGVHFDDLFHLEAIAASVRACDPESFDALVSWAPMLVWEQRDTLLEMARRDEVIGAKNAVGRMEARLNLVFSEYTPERLQSIRDKLNARGEFLKHEEYLMAARYKESTRRELIRRRSELAREEAKVTQRMDADDFEATRAGKHGPVRMGMDVTISRRQYRYTVPSSDDAESETSETSAATVAEARSRLQDLENQMGQLARTAASLFAGERGGIEAAGVLDVDSDVQRDEVRSVWKKWKSGEEPNAPVEFPPSHSAVGPGGRVQRLELQEVGGAVAFLNEGIDDYTAVEPPKQPATASPTRSSGGGGCSRVPPRSKAAEGSKASSDVPRPAVRSRLEGVEAQRSQPPSGAATPQQAPTKEKSPTPPKPTRPPTPPTPSELAPRRAKAGANRSAQSAPVFADEDDVVLPGDTAGVAGGVAGPVSHAERRPSDVQSAPTAGVEGVPNTNRPEAQGAHRREAARGHQDIRTDAVAGVVGDGASAGDVARAEDAMRALQPDTTLTPWPPRRPTTVQFLSKRVKFNWNLSNNTPRKFTFLSDATEHKSADELESPEDVLNEACVRVFNEHVALKAEEFASAGIVKFGEPGREFLKEFIHYSQFCGTGPFKFARSITFEETIGQTKMKAQVRAAAKADVVEDPWLAEEQK